MAHYIMKTKMYQTDSYIDKALELFSVAPDVKIAALLLPGDVDFTNDCAASLAAYIKDNVKEQYDTILTAEFKGAFLAQSLCQHLFKLGCLTGNRFVAARKNKKTYMGNAVGVNIKTITTCKRERLYLSEADANYINGKRVLLVDDVISTGGAMAALSALAAKCNARCFHKACVAVEGVKNTPTDIIALANIPLFNKNGVEFWIN